MKIAIFGDVHGNWKSLNIAVAQAIQFHPDITHLFQVGDFGDGFPGQPHFEWDKYCHEEIPNLPLHFCDGNHDNHTLLREKGGSNSFLARQGQVIYQPRGSVLEVDGLRILFFGGATSPDKIYRTEGINWWREESITYSEVMRVLENVKKPIDAIVSHDFPESFKYRTYFQDFGKSDRQALQALLEHFNPLFWFFGHHHKAGTGIENGCQWACLPEITGLLSMIWDGENFSWSTERRIFP